MKSIHPMPFVSVLIGSVASAAPLEFKPIAKLPLAGAEISDYDPASKRIFVTADVGLQVVDLSDPANPTLVTTIDFTDLGLPGTDVTSVAVANGVAAVALPDPVKTQNGRVAFLHAADLSLISSVEVGALPDALTFTPDGSKVLVANEGELDGDPIDDVTPGTVSIIDVSGGFASPTVVTADFTAYDDPAVIAQLRADGVRIFEHGKPSTDFEPEYVAVSPDGSRAMVTLQEANAVAILDIATATFTDVIALGEKDFSGLLADFSDRDGPENTQAIRLSRGNPVFGLYMPDAIAAYSTGGKNYYVIANEGDDRNDFLSTPETILVGDPGYVLSEAVFPNAAELKQDDRLGRLTVSNSPGLRGDNEEGEIERILMYGARSFSILDEDGAMVYDSGDIIERAIANIGAPWFDDSRSDNKGPEPEGVQVGEIDGRTYAFITLERSRGVIAFDVTDPADVQAAGFATVPTDRNPEDVTFIPAERSPNGKNLLAVTNENASTSLGMPTLTIYQVEPGAFTLQLLHLADAEAGLLASQTAPNLAALVDAFEGSHPHTLILSGGDNFIPGPFMNAGTDPSMTPVLRDALGDPAVSTAFGRPDIAIHNILGVEASALGNHEFDLGSNVLSDAIGIASFPHLTANLDFTADPLNSRFTAVTLDGAETPVPDAATLAGRVVPTATIEKGGEKIGLVGVTTQVLESISSPSGARVRGFAEPRTGVDDMDLLASQVQPYIDELLAEGVNKIILLSHLQQLSNERALATKIRGVDIILAAGSNTRLGDADDVAVEFLGHAANFAGPYPIVTAGLDEAPVLIVNTDNEFTYLGRLVVDFNADGEVIVSNLATRSIGNGAYAATAANVAAAWGVHESELEATAFATGSRGARVRRITDAIQGIINDKDGQVFGFTTVYLEGERAFVRREETNFGNLSADANAEALRAIEDDGTPVVSLKNGGGIRAQIGSIEVGSGAKLPPAANPAAGKPEGAVSRLDIENALRFNNRLMAFDTTPQGLKAILEHGVAVWPNNGRFPQIAGVAFSWDITADAGSRIRTIALIDEEDRQSAAIYHDGEFLPNAPALIRMVTLNFLANGGDGYPMKESGGNFRFLLDDGSVSDAIDPAVNFTTAGVVPANAMGEQQAFEEFLAVRHATPDTAYATADTPIDEDFRIQKIDVRGDEVLPFDPAQLLALNDYADDLRSLGLPPLFAITMERVIGGIDGLRADGRLQVLGDPAAFGLFTEDSIQDLRGNGLIVRVEGEQVELRLPLERSTTLAEDGWLDAGELRATLEKIDSREFYRLVLPE